MKNVLRGLLVLMCSVFSCSQPALGKNAIRVDLDNSCTIDETEVHLNSLIDREHRFLVKDDKWNVIKSRFSVHIKCLRLSKECHVLSIHMVNNAETDLSSHLLRSGTLVSATKHEALIRYGAEEDEFLINLPSKTVMYSQRKRPNSIVSGRGVCKTNE